MTKKRSNISLKIKKKIVSSLNKGLVPVEYSYKAIKKMFKNVKKTAPLVYEEVDSLIKSNIVTIDKKRKISKKAYWTKLGEAITSNLIQKIPSMV